MQVAVSRVVAVRLVVLGISQPPLAAVGRLPHLLLLDTELHGVFVASTTPVFLASHIDKQVRLSRVLADGLAHSIIHFSPVLLAAWRPNLVSRRARIF